MQLRRFMGWYDDKQRLVRVRVQTETSVFEVETAVPERAIFYSLSESGVLRFDAVKPENEP